MKERKFFVVRTEALGKPHYFCGLLPTDFGPVIGIAERIFNALEFDDKESAEAAISECGLVGPWTVSECVGGSS